MSVYTVSPSTAINMMGPYLAAQVTCPCCTKVNTFVRVEGPTSDVKPVDICQHIRAYLIDEEGESQFEFSD